MAKLDFKQLKRKNNSPIRESGLIVRNFADITFKMRVGKKYPPPKVLSVNSFRQVDFGFRGG